MVWKIKIPVFSENRNFTALQTVTLPT